MTHELDSIRCARCIYYTLKRRVRPPTSRREEHASLFPRGRHEALSKSREMSVAWRGAAWRGTAGRAVRRGVAQLQLQGIYHPRVTPRATGRATKGRVTKTTYIFSTQFQTLKGKRDLRLWSCINYTFHKHDVRPPSCTRRVPREGHGSVCY